MFDFTTGSSSDSRNAIQILESDSTDKKKNKKSLLSIKTTLAALKFLCVEVH